MITNDRLFRPMRGQALTIARTGVLPDLSSKRTGDTEPERGWPGCTGSAAWPAHQARLSLIQHREKE